VYDVSYKVCCAVKTVEGSVSNRDGENT